MKDLLLCFRFTIDPTVMRLMMPSSSDALVEPQEAPADGSQGSPPEEHTTGAATPPAALGNAIPFMAAQLFSTGSAFWRPGRPIPSLTPTH